MAQSITEEMKVHEEWYKEARDMTPDKLADFIKHLMDDFNHDYGTICHALTAGAIATMWAMNKHPQGGITGFQAGCIMWSFIQHWNKEDNKTGMKLIDYDNMLYPQYDDDFEKTVSSDVWKALQEEAQNLITKHNKEFADYLEKCQQYKVDLANFIKKHPDYDKNPKKYERLGCGNAEEWDEYHKKEASGFEFAPDEPFCIVIPGKNPVYDHWKSIVDGKVPFGYTISDD